MSWTKEEYAEYLAKKAQKKAEAALYAKTTRKKKTQPDEKRTAFDTRGSIFFTIPITPTAQMRDRIGKRELKDGTTRGSSYKDDKQKAREETLYALLAPYKPQKPYEGALLLGVRVYLPLPKGKPEWFDGTEEEFREYALDGWVRPQGKPDWDNFQKQIKDCLTKMGFWHDDAQVVGNTPHSGKYYSGTPRWEISIAPWNWRKGLKIRSKQLALFAGAVNHG